MSEFLDHATTGDVLLGESARGMQIGSAERIESARGRYVQFVKSTFAVHPEHCAIQSRSARRTSASASRSTATRTVW
jgi:hypothetical protein